MKPKITLDVVARFLASSPDHEYTLADIRRALKPDWDTSLDHRERDELRRQMFRDSRIDFVEVPGVMRWKARL